jgi:hypothetical protein
MRKVIRSERKNISMKANDSSTDKEYNQISVGPHPERHQTDIDLGREAQE